MGPRMRKLVGGVALLAFLGFYIWLAVMIGERVPQHPGLQLLYYAVAGTAWGLPLKPLFTWMNARG